MELALTAAGLKKVFNRRVIFQRISFTLTSGQTLLISGRNGSGKSTLVKILSEVLTPSEGTVEMSINDTKVTSHRIPWVGLVSPYLQMYEEFSALENLKLAMAIRGLRANVEELEKILARVSLFGRHLEPVRTYSSGMKQRMKYAFALAHRPPILILDEPTSNLDNEGIAMVHDLMQEHRQQGILIIATNDLSDVDRFDAEVNLNGPH